MREILTDVVDYIEATSSVIDMQKRAIEALELRVRNAEALAKSASEKAELADKLASLAGAATPEAAVDKMAAERKTASVEIKPLGQGDPSKTKPKIVKKADQVLCERLGIQYSV